MQYKRVLLSKADSVLNILDAWQLIPQFLRQNAGDAVLTDANRLGHVLERVFRDQIVFGFAEKKPNGRIIALCLQNPVHRGEVEVELTGIL